MLKEQFGQLCTTLFSRTCLCFTICIHVPQDFKARACTCGFWRLLYERSTPDFILLGVGSNRTLRHPLVSERNIDMSLLSDSFLFDGYVHRQHHRPVLYVDRDLVNLWKKVSVFLPQMKDVVQMNKTRNYFQVCCVNVSPR